MPGSVHLTTSRRTASPHIAVRAWTLTEASGHGSGAAFVSFRRGSQKLCQHEMSDCLFMKFQGAQVFSARLLDPLTLAA